MALAYTESDVSVDEPYWFNASATDIIDLSYVTYTKLHKNTLHTLHNIRLLLMLFSEYHMSMSDVIKC